MPVRKRQTGFITLTINKTSEIRYPVSTTVTECFMRSDNTCMTTYHRFDESMNQLEHQLTLRRDPTPKAMIYNISISNSFNNEPTTLTIEFIDQDEISSIITVKDAQAGMSERGVVNLDLNLTVDSEMKYGLELRTAEYTSLIEEQLLSAV